ncbi:MAG: EF-hand domain-containing protein [Planctomycetales bacterium]|nr:EF-hand domain-containing protein [Planctomycetales bacterium]
MLSLIASSSLIASVLATVGCGSGLGRVDAPDVDPEECARLAFESYDANSDDRLDAAELKACPAVSAKFAVYDANEDGAVDPAEFAARLENLFGKRVGLTQLKCSVTLRGRPLAGARVEFEPEPYLGEGIAPASGETDEDGSAQMSVAKERLPSDLQRLRAVHYGTYKVRITHPQLALADRYNVETELGYETESGNPSVSFDLKR